MMNKSNKVILGDYPELHLAYGYLEEVISITREEAFFTYLYNWGWVDEKRLSEAEAELIDSLTQEFGRGHFFPRAHGRARITPEFLKVAIPETDIPKDMLAEFERTVDDERYPGRRNGIMYFWRSDYEVFLTENNAK